MKNESKRTWAEINLDALQNNMKIIRDFTMPNAQIMAVVKADAYGHGVKEVAENSPVPSLRGPCDRSLKSEVPCGSCLNWR